MGGSEGIVSALVRGLEKHGGRLLLRSHVDSVVVEGGRAAGALLRPRAGATTSGSDSDAEGPPAPPPRREVVRARMGVISNASVWDTARLLPPGAVPAEWRARSEATPQTGSFMHLHLGIDAAGLPDDLECHHLWVLLLGLGCGQRG
jgi:phytoene dehydrogenase-like protein